jgi:hypothetical protein
MDIDRVQEWFMDVMDNDVVESIIQDMMAWYYDSLPMDRHAVAVEVCGMLLKVAIRRPLRDVHRAVFKAFRTLNTHHKLEQHCLFRELLVCLHCM